MRPHQINDGAFVEEYALVLVPEFLCRVKIVRVAAFVVQKVYARFPIRCRTFLHRVPHVEVAARRPNIASLRRKNHRAERDNHALPVVGRRQRFYNLLKVELADIHFYADFGALVGDNLRNIVDDSAGRLDSQVEFYRLARSVGHNAVRTTLKSDGLKQRKRTVWRVAVV